MLINTRKCPHVNLVWSGSIIVLWVLFTGSIIRSTQVDLVWANASMDGVAQGTVNRRVEVV